MWCAGSLEMPASWRRRSSLTLRRAPRWRGDGREVFYLNAGGRAIMAAEIRMSAQEVETGTAQELFAAVMAGNSGDTPFPYDVVADCQRS